MTLEEIFAGYMRKREAFNLAAAERDTKAHDLEVAEHRYVDARGELNDAKN